jgi:hypothetical protein
MSALPLNIDYERLIRGYVKLATGLPNVIPGNYKAPRPSAEYATVTPISNKKLGFSSYCSLYNEQTDDITYTTSSTNVKKFSVQIYSLNSHDLAECLPQFFETPVGEYYLVMNGLSVIDWSDARQTDFVTDGQYEKRSTVELTFVVTKNITQTIQNLESAEILTKIGELTEKIIAQ